MSEMNASIVWHQGSPNEADILEEQDKVQILYNSVFKKANDLEKYMIENKWFDCDEDMERDIRYKNTYDSCIRQALQYIQDALESKKTNFHKCTDICKKGDLYCSKNDDKYCIEYLNDIKKRISKMYEKTKNHSTL